MHHTAGRYLTTVSDSKWPHNKIPHLYQIKRAKKYPISCGYAPVLWKWRECKNALYCQKIQVQSKPTEDTKKNSNMLLDYASTYLNAVIRYHASDMVLHVDPDAAYLVFTNAQICTAGHFYLRKWPPPKPPKTNPKQYGTILTEVRATKNAVSSAAESETAGVFSNGKRAVEIHPSLIDIGHPQLAILIKMENYTSDGFFNSTMKSKR